LPGETREHPAYEAPLSWQLAPRSSAAFTLAVVSVAVATLVRIGLEGVASNLAPFVTYFPAILVTTLVGGAASGILAVVLGGLCAGWFFLEADLPLGSDIANLSLYLATSLLIVWCAERFRSLCERLKAESLRSDRHLALISDQNEVLAQIAARAPLKEVFVKLLRSIESYSRSEMLGSILLLDSDGRHLRHGAAPSLPDAYNDALDGTEIGPAVGSCGTAAHLRQTVIVPDIATDPLWENWRELALRHGLRACWSVPIMSRGSERPLGTFAIYYRTPRRPAAEELEVISFMSRTAAVAIECDRQEKQQQLLIGELSHRLKNTLATVQSLASQTLRSKIDVQVWRDFEARLVRLSKTHDLLLRQRWESVELRELVVQSVLEPFESRGRIHVEGPPIRLPPRLTLLLAMVLHELCTNAEKYGALSNDVGKISITWTIARDSDATDLVDLRWAETGGPPVKAPVRRGFGTLLLERALKAEMGGMVALDYRPQGLVCDLRMRLNVEPTHTVAAESVRIAPMNDVGGGRDGVQSDLPELPSTS
jgi:two-component sensor histidine kinase